MVVMVAMMPWSYPGRSAQRAERRPHLGGEELRFLPGGEVAAAVDLVEVREAWVDRLGPAARSREELAGERREADGDGDRRRCVAGRLGRRHEASELPVPPGGCRAGAGQPIERDVVEDGVPGEIADGLAVDERAGDLVVAVRVVVVEEGEDVVVLGVRAVAAHDGPAQGAP